MSSGLLALLDDVAAIAKVASSSLDDVSLQAVKASSKAAGVVIDDTAVTPKYVVGLSPERELPIIWNIAKGSLKNKLVYLVPIALFLGWAAPWAVSPLLACGGVFLCFEGYEKLHHAFSQRSHTIEDEADTIEQATITPEELERIRTSGAIRTDFILSAEIVAIAYATVATESFFVQFFSLVIVALLITTLVYGFVAVVVKADDFGLHLARDYHSKSVRLLGLGIIKGMPAVLVVLSYIGTAAMLWVGGGIIIHGFPTLHHPIEHFVSNYSLTGFAAWSIEAGISFIFGVIVGFLADSAKSTFSLVSLSRK
jgi:predicted DNA repair protein MutK